MNKNLSRRSFLKFAGALTAGVFAKLSGLVPEMGLTQAAGEQYQPLTGTRAERYIRLTLSSAQYRSFTEQLRREFNGVFNPEESQSRVGTIANQVLVAIPVSGGAGHSYFGAWFDQASDRVAATSVGLFTYTLEHNIALHMERNGKVLADAILRPSGEAVTGVAYDAQGNPTVLDGRNLAAGGALIAEVEHNFLCCLDACLEATGIPSFVLSALGVMCGLTCLGGPTVPCLACITSAGILLGFEAGYCVGQCLSGHVYGNCTW